MKTVKKIISLILSAIMLISCFGALAASAADYNHLPQIYVEGLDSKRIYYKDDVNQEKPLFFPIDGDMIISNLLNYEKYIEQAILEEDPDLLKNYLCLWMQDCFGMVAIDKDGYTMSDEVMVNETTLNYDGNGKYVFKYDSRLDAVDIAAELDAYIKWVQEDSGSEKFELAGSSYGSSVVLAYLNEYPEMRKNIDSLVLCVPSTNGVNFASELFSGKINLTPDAIETFVNAEIGIPEVSLLISALNKTGTFDYLLDAALEPALRAVLLDALREVIRDIFGSFPSMWSFVNDENFEDALVFIYGENYADPNHEYAGVIGRITYYHNNVKVNSYNIINNAVEEGIKVNIICKYGNPAVPLGSEASAMSDGLVGLKEASFGATCYNHNQKLPESYTQAAYTQYNLISPDGCVDASTGILPLNTWYIRGLNHGEKSDTYYELINTVLYEDLDVFSNSKFPQYLRVPDYDDEELVPITPDNAFVEEEETTWLEDFLRLVMKLLTRAFEWLKGLFA